MSTAPVPRQPPHPQSPAPPDPPPAVPRASEATRLLCAGTYQDATYRDRVIEELYLKEHRIAAPALGHDAARVLAHALRARREELGWSAAVLALWAVGLPLSGWLLTGPLLAGLVLALAPARRGGQQGSAYRVLVLAAGHLVFAVTLAVLLGAAFGAFSPAGTGSSYDSSSSYDPYAPYGDASAYGSSDGTSDLLDVLFPVFGGGGVEPWRAWTGLGTLVLIALCAAARRDRFARVFAGELSPDHFADPADDPCRAGRRRALPARPHPHPAGAARAADHVRRGPPVPRGGVGVRHLGARRRAAAGPGRRPAAAQQPRHSGEDPSVARPAAGARRARRTRRP